jgi:MYXO-CTERM domain-containing protein
MNTSGAPITADPIGDPVNDDSPTPPSSSADQTTDMRGSCAYGGNAPNPWWAALLALAAMRLRRTS